jgi:hypothetical protein
LKRRQAVARVLEDAVEAPLLGFRVGLEPLLGLLPGAGGVVNAMRMEVQAENRYMRDYIMGKTY